MTSACRILLVDDDEMDARLAQEVLAAARAGDDVLWVPDGKDALDYLYRRDRFADTQAPQPSLVLLDLKMPRKDGFEVLQTAKSDPALMVIPIVVLTSSRQDNDLARAYRMGANGYVVKALDFREYREALSEVCRFWLDINETPPECTCRPRFGNRRSP